MAALPVALLLSSALAWGGGTVVVCDDVRDPLTLDAQRQFTDKNHTLLQQVYEGLVRFDADGKVEPALAVSWERMDPLRMRFKLREGVRFHDGEPFDAEAVRFSIQRYLDPATGFPAIGFINSLESGVVVDSHTVDIVTRYPDGLLLNRLAGFILIVPPAYLKERGPLALSEHPIGTGPFVFEKWVKGDRIELSANRDYWEAGIPRIDRLVFRFLPWDRQVGELLKGRVDILTELPGTRTAEVERSRAARVVKRETFYTMTAPFNVSRGPLADRRVRQALNYAVDREDLIRYDVLGNGRVIATLTLPGEEGHDPDLKPYPFDLKEARRLLKEAGYGGGLTLEGLVKQQGVRTAKIIQKQWSAAGVKLDIHATSDADIIKDIASRPWDLVFGGVPDPMCHTYFIQSIVLYSKSPFAVGKFEAFDKMLEEMVGTLDPADRAAKARKIDRLIHDEVLSVFTYQRIKTYGVSRRVAFVPSVTGMPYFFNIKIHGETTPLGPGERAADTR